MRPKLLDSTTNSILQAPAPDRTVKKMQCRSEPGSPGYCRKVPGSTSLVSPAKALFKTWVNISDSTMGDWLTAAANLMLTLYEAHKKDVIGCNYLHADETATKVLESERKGAIHLENYWVYQAHEKNWSCSIIKPEEEETGLTRY